MESYRSYLLKNWQSWMFPPRQVLYGVVVLLGFLFLAWFVASYAGATLEYGLHSPLMEARY